MNEWKENSLLISNFVGKLFTRAANSISNTGDGKEEFSSGKLNWRCKLHKKGVECFKIFHNDLNDSKKGVDHEPAHGMTQLRCMKYIIRHERERGPRGRKYRGNVRHHQPVTRGYEQELSRIMKLDLFSPS